MATIREHTAPAGPVVFDVTTVAADVIVIVEDRPAALVTVTTSADSGPAADAVRNARFADRPGGVSVRVQEPTGATGSTTVVNRYGRATITQVGIVSGGSVIQVGGNIIGGDLNISGGGLVIGGNAAVTGSGAPIVIEARLPLRSSLTCQTTSGDLDTTGELVDAEVTTVSGDIRIGAARMPRLRSTSGDIRVAQLTGSRAVVKTVSGDIRITATQSGATVSARSVSGDIRATGPDIDLDARTVSGRVTTR
ncbi:DUF4097 family beta strand repeat-containing protein [Actinoplanes subtropicus]|uniref:DUF4097 family beta strand repeat-containing protein n=1 Tax=Actinoplanes subtropicus TaxID=543632 RepID=UPI0004C3077A|nr:DUF4097 family beta strand repeat-containing protein [Actinoplanes subtropicus]